MNILAIDTTTKKASIALKKGNQVISKSIDNEITHSEKLLPLIQDVLTDANLNINNIDLFACTLGPGSFTGVRIGIATIKALAKVTNTKIYGITSLELLALNALAKCDTTPNYVLSLMDAKNSRAYYTLYKYEDNNLTPTEVAGNDLISNILEKLQDLNLTSVIIATLDLDNNDLLNNYTSYTVISSLLDLADIFKLNLNKEENIYDYLNVDAIYLRKSEAERTKLGE